jgi:DNA-binding winged helix-turn-helix (wHTH) protein
MYKRIYKIGGVEFAPEISPGTGEITKPGQIPIHFIGQQYRALKILSEAEGRIVLNEQLAEQVSQNSENTKADRLPNLINRLRDSFRELGVSGDVIRNHRDPSGYSLEATWKWASRLTRLSENDLRYRFWSNLCTTPSGLTLVYPIHEVYIENNGRLWADRSTAIQHDAELCQTYTGVGEFAGAIRLAQLLCTVGVVVEPKPVRPRVIATEPAADFDVSRDSLWLGSPLASSSLTEVLRLITPVPTFGWKKTNPAGQLGEVHIVKNGEQTVVKSTLWGGEREYAVLLLGRFTSSGNRFCNIAGTDTRATEAALRMLTEEPDRDMQKLLVSLLTMLTETGALEVLLEVNPQFPTGPRVSGIFNPEHTPAPG